MRNPSVSKVGADVAPEAHSERQGAREKEAEGGQGARACFSVCGWVVLRSPLHAMLMHGSI